MALVFMGAVTACVNEDEFCTDSVKQTTKEGLAVLPTISESSLIIANTREDSEEDPDPLKEKALNTLDVFVEHVTGTTGDGTFMLQYHLTSNIVENDLNKLAERWRHEGLLEGEKYNIYVAVNNSQTKGRKDLTTFNVAALKALVYDEVTDGIAKVNTANNDITWDGDITSGKIYKLYDANPGNARALTSEKDFMMDGVTENWTPNPATQDQTFDVTLNRAAAKIVLNVKFDPDFLKSLTHTKKINGEEVTWVEKPAAEKVTIDGSPAWKFYNFAFGAPVFTPDSTPTSGVEVHNSDFNIFHNQSYTGDDKHFSIITYSYPNAWQESKYSTDAPSLVISVGYKEGASETVYNYYRIPLVKSTVTSLERNHIYVIDATIATRGSESHEDVTEMDNLVYEVANWNDKSNNDAIHNEVESVQHMYLKVNPVVYTLHGDDNQSLIINYQKATGTEVGYKVFAINTTTGAKGDAVEPGATNAVWAWYYDKNGNMRTTYGSGNSSWPHLNVTFAQSTEGINDSKGTITVNSTALYNRAIKYILLRVYLKDKPELYEDVLIRHFPTDNIQSITGQWSSYHTGGTAKVETWDPVAEGWEEGTYESEEVEVNSTDPYERSEVKYDGTPSNHDSGDYRYNYSTGQNGSTVQTQYRNNVSQGVNRYNTNGESNAALGADGYWYWGDTRMTVNSGNNYDWRGNNGTSYNGTRYRWTNYYRSQYKKTHYYRTRYYRTIAVTPETGNWVDWDRDHNQSGTSTRWINRNGEFGDKRFTAHVWNASDNHVHNIASANYNLAYDSGTQSGAGHMNNHMYVVQISSTSSKYVLGKPVLGNPGPYQSYDEVVSPAFMIASQLGVVSSGWQPADAAEHCARYMEVGTDGTRYIGWRLPTNDEIDIISDYQMGRFGTITIPEADRVMDYVLKGANYYNLSGGTTPSNYTTGNDNFLRCIRELSAEEIEKLNGFDALIEKYQKK